MAVKATLGSSTMREKGLMRDSLASAPKERFP